MWYPKLKLVKVGVVLLAAFCVLGALHRWAFVEEFPQDREIASAFSRVSDAQGRTHGYVPVPNGSSQVVMNSAFAPVASNVLTNKTPSGRDLSVSELDKIIAKKYDVIFKEFEKRRPNNTKAAKTVASKTKYMQIPLEFECDPLDLGPRRVGAVYWGIFAGRRDRLQIQEKYWVQLHNAGILTEVHLWDFTYLYGEKTKDAQLNKEWIHAKSKEYDFVKIKTAEMAPGRRFFLNFYQYYAENLGPNDVALKVDDDVLWLNGTELPCLLTFVHDQTDHLVVHTNIINNPVMAHIQQNLGMIPKSLGTFEYPHGGNIGRLYHNPAKGLELHKYFLANKKDFYLNSLIRYFERNPINFIGFNQRSAKEAYLVAKYVFDHPKKFSGSGDETAITTFANAELSLSDAAYMRMVVAHGAFYGQWKKSPKTMEQIADLYAKEPLPKVVTNWK